MKLELLSDVLRNSILITGLVVIMMLMIEYFNIQSKGQWFSKLKGSGIKQIILGAALGLIPGCIGGFATVSLFTHKLISFGALIAMMICSSGDEAFVILAMIPQKAPLLFGALFLIGITCGIIVDKFIKKPIASSCPDGYEIHSGAADKLPSLFKLSSYKEGLKKPSEERLIILVGIILFIFTVAGGYLEHDHSAQAADAITNAADAITHAADAITHAADAHTNAADAVNTAADAVNNAADAVNTAHALHAGHSEHVHSHFCESATHAHIGLNLLSERWIHVIFAIFSIITVLFTATAKEHFIKDHIWGHVIKKHLLSIFLWTFGALLVCQIGIMHLDIQHWISNNMFLVLLLAVAVGLIPESGPHLVFVTLFAQGIIPFYVLLVNSMVQDGHTTLPLLAESKSAFFKAKLINMAAGLLIGLICWALM